MALLHNCLFDYYEEYEKADAIPMSVWQEIDRVYQTYHALGGNDTVARIYDHLRTKRLLKDE